MLAALLVSHYDELPAAAEILKKLNELKQLAAAERKSYPGEQLIQYPPSPHDMPKDVFDYA